MQHIYYFRTPAGEQALRQRDERLSPRERQIMLMCSGQRSLQVQFELFGDSVVRELHELVVRGFLQAMRRVPDEWAADAAAMSEAMDFAASQTQIRLAHARDLTTVVAEAMATADARALVAANRHVTDADAVLAYAVALVELLFRAGDEARTLRVGYKIADLLPRNLVPLWVDRLLDGPNPALATALYEHLLSGQDVASFDDDMR